MYAAIDGFFVHLQKNGQKINGFPIYDYHVVTPEGVIFVGDSLKPSLSSFKYEPLLILELLQYITIPFGEIDEEYFENYNDTQLAFAHSLEIKKHSEIIELCYADMVDSDIDYYTQDSVSEVISFESDYSKLVIIHEPE